MKFVFAFVCLAAVVAIANAGQVPAAHLHNEKWQAFKQRYGKQYSSSSSSKAEVNGQGEEAKRFQIWQENMAAIEAHNAKYEAGEETYFLAENQWADLTNDEYRQQLLLPKNAYQNLKPANAEIWRPSGENAIDSIDWRQKGAVNPIRDQNPCGSCWAFATVAAVEAQFFLTNGTLVAFSEQQLVDCVTACYGCHGGLPTDAYDYLQTTGLQLAQSYPYKRVAQKCAANPAQMYLPKIKGYTQTKPGDEKALQDIIAKRGPATVGVNSSRFSWQFYSGGVYYDARCTGGMRNLDHAVTVVGFGTDKIGNDYWLVRNSWGTGWGEHGYIRMARNRGNNCGIADDCNVPNL